MIVKNEAGLTLVGSMIAAAVVAGLALAGAQIAGNLNDVTTRSSAAQDEASMLAAINNILSNSRHCRASFISDLSSKTATTYSSDIKRANLDDNTDDSEGLEIGLWYGDSDGLRLKDSADFFAGSGFGNITIKSLKVYFPYGGSGEWDASLDNEIELGQLVIVYDKKVGVRNKQNKIFKSDMNFFVSTKADRSLDKLTCVGSNSEARKLSLADACSSAGGFSTMNMCVFAQYLAGGYTMTIPAEAAGVASVTVIGGGGGMGMKDHSHWNGYGGGGGGAANKRMLLEAGATYKIEVGPGRITSTSGWSNSRNLGPGGTSQFIDNDTSTVIMSATGGKSGREVSGASNIAAPGGVGSGGDVNCTGGTGRNGKYFEGQGESGQCLGGSGGAGGTGGGASIYGGEGGSGKCGAGGGRFHGQNGADGCIIIEW